MSHSYQKLLSEAYDEVREFNRGVETKSSEFAKKQTTSVLTPKNVKYTATKNGWDILPVNAKTSDTGYFSIKKGKNLYNLILKDEGGAFSFEILMGGTKCWRKYNMSSDPTLFFDFLKTRGTVDDFAQLMRNSKSD